MKLATFVYQGSRRVGLLSDDGLRVQTLDLSTQENERGILSLVDRKASGKPFPAVNSESIALSDVKLEAPIPRPMRNIFCVGRNYHAHAKELSTTVFKDNNVDPNAWPIVFTKVPECVTGPYDDVYLPLNVSQQIDYEAELAVIIGKECKNLTEDNALDAIAGYSCFNDGSVREFQRHTIQWTMGKNFDKTGPFGPIMVTPDELPEAATGLKIECRLNGQTVQSSTTDMMIFPVIETLVYITKAFTLEPGDLVIMGTPSGVGHARKPPLWMKDGDLVEIEIEGIGILANPIKAE